MEIKKDISPLSVLINANSMSPVKKVLENILYARRLDRYAPWKYIFLLNSPINIPPPVTWGEWLSWKFGGDFDNPNGRYYREAEDFRHENQINDSRLGTIVDPAQHETGRVKRWFLSEGPQPKANEYLRKISDRFGPMAGFNRPNPRLSGIVLQTFPSALNGWKAAYAESDAAVKSLSDALESIGEDTVIQFIR